MLHAAAEQPLALSDYISFTGVINAIVSRTKTVVPTLVAVFAAGLGPSGTAQNGSHKMPSVDASTPSLNLNLTSSDGATSATNLLIKTVAIAKTAVSAAGPGPRMTAPGGNLRTLPVGARMWSDTTRTISLAGETSATNPQTKTVVTTKTQLAVSAVGRGPSGTAQSGSLRSLAADASTESAN